MKKQIFNFILLTIIVFAFFACEEMATLFHGEKPTEPPPPPVTYTVTYNANGANGTPPEVQIVNNDAVIILPDKGGMSSTGNIFLGWNESSSGGGTTYSVGTSVTVTRNMVFYAQWLDGNTPQWTVTFDRNGATSGSPPPSQTVYSGMPIIIPNQGTLVYSGKIFGGWNTNANGSETNYAEGASYTVNENVSFYAQWKSVAPHGIPNITNYSSLVDQSIWNEAPFTYFYFYLYYTSVEGADLYRIQLRRSGFSGYIEMTSNTTSICLNNWDVSLNVTYLVKVRAENDAGVSGWSQEFTLRVNKNM